MPAFPADFSVADDLLREAALGRLAGHSALTLKSVGRIGPVVEVALASIEYKAQYEKVSFVNAFGKSLVTALDRRSSFGSGYKDVSGAFPLETINPVTHDLPDWDLWTKHAENIAVTQGSNRNLIAALLGSMVELQDNIYEHSGAPETGLIAYAVTPFSFEFVVADRGIGVLKSLQQNSTYTSITDSGHAIELAITSGISRFPKESGRGQGFNQLFRALVGHNAEIRFRSGDHALTLKPGAISGTAVSTMSQLAPLRGFAISVFCSDTSSNPT